MQLKADIEPILAFESGLEPEKKLHRAFKKLAQASPGFCLILIEPERARACQNILRACFKPENFTNKNAKIQLRAYFESFGKLGSLSLESGAYLLRAKILARALEPEPRLLKPLNLRFWAQS